MLAFNLTAHTGPISTWFPPSYNDELAHKLQLFMTSKNDVDKNYVLENLEALVDFNPNYPLTLALQANFYCEYQNFHGALASANRAANILLSHQVSDPIYNAWRIALDGQVKETEKANVALYSTHLASWRRSSPVLPPTAFTLAPVDCSSVMRAWSELKNHLTDAEAESFMARLMAIESSELEQVFELAGNSESRLVRAGLVIGAIERVGPASEIKSPQKILYVLRNFQQALKVVVEEWRNTSTITAAMILRAQRHIVKGTRVRTSNGGEPHMIASATWRNEAVFVSSSRIVLHDHWVVGNSIAQLLELVEPLLKTLISSPSEAPLDPYSAAAWLHHMLVSIHPFGDKNGRTSRLIASLPLMVSGLPMINVFASDRHEYLESIKQADVSGDLRPLASFLQAQSIKTATRLYQIKQTAPADPLADEDTYTGTGTMADLLLREEGLYTGPVHLQ